MATAPNLIVAGHPDLARKLRNTGRFPAVFDIASATALRELSQSGRVAAPATFMFGPDFDEDLPDAGVAVLANGLGASGFTVIVHSVFSQRGDVFDPRVIADTGPLTMAKLLDLLYGRSAGAFADAPVPAAASSARHPRAAPGRVGRSRTDTRRARPRSSRARPASAAGRAHRGTASRP